MDLFEESTHAALRGALAACQQGRWSDHALRANALLTDGTVLPLEITLTLGEHEGEPLHAPGGAVAPARGAVRHCRAGSRTSSELRAERLATPAPAACVWRWCASNTSPRSSAWWGVTASEEVVSVVARLLKDTLHRRRSRGGAYGSSRCWNAATSTTSTPGASSMTRIQRHVMRINDKSISVTCTIGLSVVAPGDPQLDAVVQDAIECARKGTARGGNSEPSLARADDDSRVMSYDRVWVKHIKAAFNGERSSAWWSSRSPKPGRGPGHVRCAGAHRDAVGGRRKCCPQNSWPPPVATIC